MRESMYRLVCFGDSICYGYGAFPGQGWVSRLANKFETLSRPIQVINSGINGNTSEDGLMRMYQDVEQYGPQAVYIQFGLNDASTWWGPMPAVNLLQFIANLGKMVERAQSCGAEKIFVATNHPVGSFVPDIFDQYRRTVAEYNDKIRECLFSRENVIGVDIEKMALAECPNPDELVLSDGVHLSPEGNAFYCSVVSRILLAHLPEF